MSLCILIARLDNEVDTVCCESATYAQGWADALSHHDLISAGEHQRVTDEIEAHLNAQTSYLTPLTIPADQ